MKLNNEHQNGITEQNTGEIALDLLLRLSPLTRSAIIVSNAAVAADVADAVATTAGGVGNGHLECILQTYAMNKLQGTLITALVYVAPMRVFGTMSMRVFGLSEARFFHTDKWRLTTRANIHNCSVPPDTRTCNYPLRTTPAE